MRRSCSTEEGYYCQVVKREGSNTVTNRIVARRNVYHIVGIFLQVHIFTDSPVVPPAEIFAVLIFMHS